MNSSIKETSSNKMSKRKKDHNQSQLSGVQGLKLKKLVALSEGQYDTISAWQEGFNLFLFGSPGTGKTFLSLWIALKEVLTPGSPYTGIKLIRSCVQSRTMGYMPGTVSEKMEVFFAPYLPMINFLFGRGDAAQITTTKNLIELVSTSFLRGVTFENCIVIVDESENCSFAELDTIMTRIGNNCRIIFCGDLAQSDLNSKWDPSGFPKFFSIIENMEEFECVEFMPEDIVRSGIVKSYILEKLRQTE